MLITEMDIPKYINLNNFVEITREKLSKQLNEIAGKDKWRRSIETNHIHGYRMNTRDNYKIIGLTIFQDNAPKEECVKYFVLKTLERENTQ